MRLWAPPVIKTSAPDTSASSATRIAESSGGGGIQGFLFLPIVPKALEESHGSLPHSDHESGGVAERVWVRHGSIELCRACLVETGLKPCKEHSGTAAASSTGPGRRVWMAGSLLAGQQLSITSCRWVVESRAQKPARSLMGRTMLSA